jgi:hypothetical protein
VAVINPRQARAGEVDVVPMDRRQMFSLMEPLQTIKTVINATAYIE